MFKRSHIILSRFLVDQIRPADLRQWRRSVSFGSVVPDMSPRQRMYDHEFAQTWEDTKERIRTIGAETITDRKSQRTVCRQIGMVLHYLADDFTCPHNPSYHIGLIRHSFYEGWQGLYLYKYLLTHKARERFRAQEKTAEKIHSEEALFAYLEGMHAAYVKKSAHTPQGDVSWVVQACAVTMCVLEPKVCGNGRPRKKV